MYIRFQEVTHTGVATGTCAACGKPYRLQRRFWQTLNPFNKTAGGAPKSSMEIRNELKAEAAEWSRTIAGHAKCAALAREALKETGDV